MHSFDWIDQKCADVAAFLASKGYVSTAKDAEHRIWGASGAPDVGAAAGVAGESGVLTAFQHLKLGLKFPRPIFRLLQLRLHLQVFRLKLLVAGFFLRQLGFDEFHALAQYHRRAMFVDQALKRIEKAVYQTHFSSTRKAV